MIKVDIDTIDNDGKIYHNLQISVVTPDRTFRLRIRPSDVDNMMEQLAEKIPLLKDLQAQLEERLAEKRRVWAEKNANRTASTQSGGGGGGAPVSLVAPRVGKTARDHANKGPKHPTNVGNPLPKGKS